MRGRGDLEKPLPRMLPPSIISFAWSDEDGQSSNAQSTFIWRRVRSLQRERALRRSNNNCVARRL